MTTSTDLLGIEDFKKIDLRIAKVIDVKEHPNADRLWILTLQTDDETTRQVVAGIRLHYPADALVGKTIVYVSNLQPATIRGIESNGMILAAKDAENLSIITLDRTVSLGSRVS